MAPLPLPGPAATVAVRAPKPSCLLPHRLTSLPPPGRALPCPPELGRRGGGTHRRGWGRGRGEELAGGGGARWDAFAADHLVVLAGAGAWEKETRWREREGWSVNLVIALAT